LSVIEMYTPAGTLSLLAHPPWLLVVHTTGVPEKLGSGVGAAA
jgi:hypothetical protein